MSMINPSYSITSEFRALQRALASPAVLAVLYPTVARTLKWGGALVAAGAAYKTSPELHGLWAVAAATVTGGVARLAMPLCEDVSGIAASAAGFIGGLMAPVRATLSQGNEISIRRALVSSTVALALGGLGGIIGGGKLTYDFVKPHVAQQTHKLSMAAPR